MFKAVIKKIRCKDGKTHFVLVVNGVFVSFDRYLMCRVARCKSEELSDFVEPP